jgi:hypothetical protein
MGGKDLICLVHEPQLSSKPFCFQPNLPTDGGVARYEQPELRPLFLNAYVPLKSPMRIGIGMSCNSFY